MTKAVNSRATASANPADEPLPTAGLVGVFATLAKDHREASALLEAAKNDAAAQSELWPQIRLALLSHEQGEIREVYPVLREYTESRQLADLHDQDALGLSDAIARLDSLPLASAEWNDAFDLLIERVTQHVDEEEENIFPVAQRVIGEKRARVVDAMFTKVKQALVQML